ncbi:MAG TPA: hypothetical protein VMU88_01750 [bacterium]|nr:hypothetical protein [bacterium]
MSNRFFLKAVLLAGLALLGAWPLALVRPARAADPWAFPAATPTVSFGDAAPSPAITPQVWVTAAPTVSPVASCAAPGASGNSKAARNYAAWCDAGLPGILFEQDDANNGLSYRVFNSTADPVDVRIGGVHLMNMDSNLNDGWIRVLPRKQADLGRLSAYDPNQDWSGGVTTTAKAAQ